MPETLHSPPASTQAGSGTSYVAAARRAVGDAQHRAGRDVRFEAGHAKSIPDGANRCERHQHARGAGDGGGTVSRRRSAVPRSVYRSLPDTCYHAAWLLRWSGAAVGILPPLSRPGVRSQLSRWGCRAWRLYDICMLVVLVGDHGASALEGHGLAGRLAGQPGAQLRRGAAVQRAAGPPLRPAGAAESVHRHVRAVTAARRWRSGWRFASWPASSIGSGCGNSTARWAPCSGRPKGCCCAWRLPSSPSPCRPGPATAVLKSRSGYLHRRAARPGRRRHAAGAARGARPVPEQAGTRNSIRTNSRSGGPPEPAAEPRRSRGARRGRVVG